MEIPGGGPAPGEELNETGTVAVPRQSASVVLLRGGSERLELLLVKRTPAARFMGGVWVFPGGAVDAGDGAVADGAGDASPAASGSAARVDADDAHRAAAVREVAEEAGIALPDPGALVPYSRWITPSRLAIRFDTWFFLAPLPDGAQPRVDGDEIVDARWLAPGDALAAQREGELALVFPTIKHLEQFSAFPSADALIAHARGREVHPVEPRVVGEGEMARVLLPGEAGYDAA